ncbi:hypothetical protein ACFE04_016982 [Oxalis oulophora]
MEAPNWKIIELTKATPNRTNIIEDIVKIERKIFPKHESLAFSFHQELNKKNSGLLYLEDIDNNGPQIVGYVMYSFPSSLFASITKLAVKENSRRQGYGEALLKAAIEKCKTRKVQRISLHVDPLRESAVNLYKKFGFQVNVVICVPKIPQVKEGRECVLVFLRLMNYSMIGMDFDRETKEMQGRLESAEETATKSSREVQQTTMSRRGMLVANFPFQTPPEDSAISEAKRCLIVLEALDGSGRQHPLEKPFAATLNMETPFVKNDDMDKYKKVKESGAKKFSPKNDAITVSPKLGAVS